LQLRVVPMQCRLVHAVGWNVCHVAGMSRPHPDVALIGVYHRGLTKVNHRAEQAAEKLERREGSGRAGLQASV
jgi:hypothetical protein